MTAPDFREALAELLSWSSGEFTRYSPDAHPDHNRWSWRGDGPGDVGRAVFYKQADDVLALLAERLDRDEVREVTMLAIAGTSKPCRKQIEANGGCHAIAGDCYCAREATAALAALRGHLGVQR